MPTNTKTNPTCKLQSTAVRFSFVNENIGTELPPPPPPDPTLFYQAWPEGRAYSLTSVFCRSWPWRNVPSTPDVQHWIPVLRQWKTSDSLIEKALETNDRYEDLFTVNFFVLPTFYRFCSNSNVWTVFCGIDLTRILKHFDYKNPF